jgi:hypothetical protein
MKIGDLVMRTYGEGRRPVAILVGWHRYGRPGGLAQVRWLGGTRVEEIGTKYLELVNEAR